LHASDANTFIGLMELATSRGHSSGDLNLRHESRQTIPARVSLTLLEIAGLANVCI